MRISDWSSDVCSSDLGLGLGKHQPEGLASRAVQQDVESREPALGVGLETDETDTGGELRRDQRSHFRFLGGVAAAQHQQPGIASRVAPEERLERTDCEIDTLVGTEMAHGAEQQRSEEHTSELQSLMRISYAVFCLKKKTKTKNREPMKP